MSLSLGDMDPVSIFILPFTLPSIHPCKNSSISSMHHGRIFGVVLLERLLLLNLFVELLGFVLEFGLT
jgi:hypothetical protein